MSRILGNWLDAYLEYTKNDEPPSQFKLWSGISTICAAMQRKCFTTWEVPIYPNMYIVLVGPAGSRKGTAMRPAKELLEALGVKMAAEAITREMLIRELASSLEAEPNEEKGVDMHCSLTIFSEELSVFIGQNQWELVSNLCNWYDCSDRWTYRTKHQGDDEIYGVWVNLFGATTPDYLRTSLPEDAIGGGLSSRMVFVYGDKKEHLDIFPFLNKDKTLMRGDLTHDLRHINMMRGEFGMSKDFMAAYAKWYEYSDKNPPFEEKIMLGYNERKATHLRKLTMAMSASRSDDMVLRGEDFQRALTILESAEKDMLKVFKGRGRLRDSDIAEDIVYLLRAQREVKASEIMRRYYRDIDTDMLDKLIQTLQRAGLCKLIVKGPDTIIRYTGKK